MDKLTLRIFYRYSQFWNALIARPDPSLLAQASQTLTPALMKLFLRMQPSEQSHSLAIYQALVEQGETNPDLLCAALLHDVGKSRSPLHLWDRVVIVLGNAFFPRHAERWGQGQPRGWKRSFVVAQKHSDWGAKMVAEAGASTVVTDLILHHQDHPLTVEGVEEMGSDTLLQRLQVLDNER